MENSPKKKKPCMMPLVLLAVVGFRRQRIEPDCSETRQHEDAPF
jgi:hypothetical protein